MKKSKGFSAKVKQTIWDLYKIHGAKYAAILNDLTEKQRTGIINAKLRLPADERSVKSYIKKRQQRERQEPLAVVNPIAGETNWIRDYETVNKKPPPLPVDLLPLALNYTQGQPISKDIQLITPSMQFWVKLLPSKQEKLLQLVDWLGQDRRDYVENIRRLAPPRSGHRTQLIPNEKVKRVIRQIDGNTWVELEP